jgi:UDP-N-acetylglucosamine 2-epimerase (non-hydrolysing)
MKNILLVAGARPNFMKLAPIVRALKDRKEINYWIVHTGQHYDFLMNEVFFQELEIPRPNFHLSVGSGSHSAQTGAIMVEFEKLCLDVRPDLVVVFGDINSTLACTVAAKKLNILVAHVEAGLRSGDKSMPEEINRLVTDSIADIFFASEDSAVAHLLTEGKEKSSIHLVGQLMSDNVLFQTRNLSTAQIDTSTQVFKRKILALTGQYAVLTLHRPANVDNDKVIYDLMKTLQEVSEYIPVIFPAHPRTKKIIDLKKLYFGKNVIVTPPLSYKNFLYLWKDAAFVMTDSGGLQEETTTLQIPCLTLRNNTERPITISHGTNILVGTDPIRIHSEANKILSGKHKRGSCPILWDGKSAERIADILTT